MPDVFKTADYGRESSAFSEESFVRATTAELAAMQTAGTVGFGMLYFDTTLSRFKIGIDKKTVSNFLLIAGNNIDATAVGSSTRSTGAFATLALTSTDSTGTPGNVTNNNPNGRAAFAAAANTVVVTNSSVAAGDTVQVTLLGAADATLLYVVGVTVAAGSFTVVGNANATATKGFMFTVIKA